MLLIKTRYSWKMPKWKQHYPSIFQLYHLSTCSLDGEVLKPRKPQPSRVMEGEDIRSKRVSVSADITRAISALGYDDYDCVGKVLFVHVPENLEELFKKGNVYKPSTKQVPDCEATHEYWLKGPAKMKLIGKIELTSMDNEAGKKEMRFEDIDGKPSQWYGKWKWKWI